MPLKMIYILKKFPAKIKEIKNKKTKEKKEILEKKPINIILEEIDNFLCRVRIRPVRTD